MESCVVCRDRRGLCHVVVMSCDEPVAVKKSFEEF